jgi:hypothetical protein
MSKTNRGNSPRSDGMALADTPAESESATAMDSTTKAIYEALQDPQYDFRTISGIANATHIMAGVVRTTLEKHPELFRLSAVPAPTGESLYTLKERPVSSRERWALARTTVASPIG